MFRNTNNIDDASKDRVHAKAMNDCRAIAHAAAALDLKEFEFFRLAYRRWFGEQPSPAYLERAFAAYMFHHRVPHWARQLSRSVLDARKERPLDADAFGAARFRDRPEPPRHGPVYFSLVVVVWLAAFSIMIDAADDPANATLSPVCAGVAGNPVFATWFEVMTGHTDAECDTLEPR